MQSDSIPRPMNPYLEETITQPVARLAGRIAELEALCQQAHEAMMNWHFAHGAPDGLMTPEEREMGDACRAIWSALHPEQEARDGR